jgi:hypothetical protein
MSNTNASDDLPESAAVGGGFLLDLGTQEALNAQERINHLTHRVSHLEAALQKQEELNLQMAQTLAKTSRVLLKLTEKVTNTVQIVQSDEE